MQEAGPRGQLGGRPAVAVVMAGHNQAGSRDLCHVIIGKDLPGLYPRFGHALRT